MKYCTWSFLLQLINSEKAYFLNSEVQNIEVPQFKELRLKNILTKVSPNDKLEKYLPDKRGGRYLLNQEFVLRLLNKLEPEYFGKLTAASFAARQVNVSSEQKTATIKIKKKCSHC